MAAAPSSFLSIADGCQRLGGVLRLYAAHHSSLPLSCIPCPLLCPQPDVHEPSCPRLESERGFSSSRALSTGGLRAAWPTVTDPEGCAAQDTHAAFRTGPSAGQQSRPGQAGLGQAPGPAQGAVARQKFSERRGQPELNEARGPLGIGQGRGYRRLPSGASLHVDRRPGAIPVQDPRLLNSFLPTLPYTTRPAS